ncbi:hypothetical protein [Streptomyces sp. NPDC051567]|uniref:hypothetical protein n=1 Tax=Streptomyces sp. NPDC051567 TaxID=3365660 RepID=UPI00378E5DC1
MTATDWIMPVLTAAFLALSYRVVRVSGAGLRVSVLFMAVMNAGLLWQVWAFGPPWSAPAVAAVSLVAAAVSARTATVSLMDRVQRVDTAGFRELVRSVTEAEGPQVMGVCVTYTGTLALTAFATDAHPEGRQFHLLPGADCPFCLVEEQIRDFLGPGDPLLGSYRSHLARGSSRHLLVKRRSRAEPWTGRLRDRVFYRVPRGRPPCPVHDPLLSGRTS